MDGWHSGYITGFVPLPRDPPHVVSAVVRDAVTIYCQRFNDFCAANETIVGKVFRLGR